MELTFHETTRVVELEIYQLLLQRIRGRREIRCAGVDVHGVTLALVEVSQIRIRLRGRRG